MTGLITWAELQLKSILSPYIRQETIRYPNLDAFFEISAESDEDFEHTVAWVDCLASSAQLGRGLFIRGNSVKELLTRPRKIPGLKLTVPLASPFSLINQYNPLAVINVAAYTQVDRAETEEALALHINGEAPGILAQWCAHRGISFVHFSTDYVFAGTSERPWTETERVAPLNAYGRTQLGGERQVAAAGGRWLIFRTSWVYDAYVR